MDREWKRYEGTPQRDLFLQLRQRFLERHRSDGGWSVDIGSGPGRFAGNLGGPTSRRVLVDLSTEMLREARRRTDGKGMAADLVRGDALRIPLRRRTFTTVAALGNPLGFAGRNADQLLGSILPLVGPRGTVLLEVVCGPGERSRYLARLPPGAVRRLLGAPVNLVRARTEREGFARLAEGKGRPSEFRRLSVTEMTEVLTRELFDIDEVLAVAPALGSEPEHLVAVRPDPLAWLHLLEVEEQLGRSPSRHSAAAAVLIAAHRR